MAGQSWLHSPRSASISALNFAPHPSAVLDCIFWPQQQQGSTAYVFSMWNAGPPTSCVGPSKWKAPLTWLMGCPLLFWKSSRGRPPVFESWPWHVSAVWWRAGHLTALSLHVFTYKGRVKHSTYLLGFHWGLNYWSVWRAKSSAWHTVSLSERQERCNLLVHISAVLLLYHHHHFVLWLSLNTCIFTIQSIFSLNMRAVDYSFFPFLVSDLGFPDGISGKNSPANAWDTRDVGLIPGSGYSPGGGNDNPL